jgi:hypothetical protein
MEPILRPQRRQALFRWCFSCAMLSSSMARISTTGTFVPRDERRSLQGTVPESWFRCQSRRCR